jgi:RecA/RadA recombinase
MNIMEDVSKELRKAVDQLNRQFAKAHGSDRVLVRMGEEIPEPRYEPTGILTLDQALGGGLPLGTVIAVPRNCCRNFWLRSKPPIPPAGW